MNGRRIAETQLAKYEAIIREDEREQVFALIEADLKKWRDHWSSDDTDARTVRLCAEQVSWLLNKIGRRDDDENHHVAGQQESLSILSVPPARALARPSMFAADEASRTLRIVVTGGRHYPNRSKVYRILDILRPTRIAEGGTEDGADRLARDWAAENGVENQSYPVTDWRDPEGNIDYSAGPRRNGRMLRAELPLLDAAVAFPGEKGTLDCKRQASKLGIPVLEVL